MAKTKKPKKNIIEIAQKKRHFHLVEKLQQGKSLTKLELAELKEFEGDNLQPGQVRTVPELAKVMGVSTRTIDYWLRDGMPKTPEGYYDIAQVTKWHAENKNVHKNELKKVKDKDSIGYWELQIKKHKAELHKIEIDTLKKKLISADEVEQGRVQRVISLKNSFLGLGRSLAPLLEGLEPPEIQAHIDDRVTYILNEYAEGNIKDFPNDITDGLDRTKKELAK